MAILILSDLGKNRERKVTLPMRPTSRQRGYSSEWDRYSRQYRKDHPVCEECRVEPSRCVDHVQAIRGADDPKFWEPTNHQALCWSCHSVKTCKYDGGYGHRRKAR